MRHASRGTSCSSAAASACSSDVEAEDLGDAVGGGRHGLQDGVRHVDEGEPRVARGVRRVERRVKDRDGEPPRVERAGQLQHRADVALERQRECPLQPFVPAPAGRLLAIAMCSPLLWNAGNLGAPASSFKCLYIQHKQWQA